MTCAPPNTTGWCGRSKVKETEPADPWPDILELAVAETSAAFMGNLLGVPKSTLWAWRQGQRCPENLAQTIRLCRWASAGPSASFRLLETLNADYRARSAAGLASMLRLLVVTFAQAVQELGAADCVALNTRKQPGTELDALVVTLRRADGLVVLLRGREHTGRPFVRALLPNRDRPDFTGDSLGAKAAAEVITRLEAPAPELTGRFRGLEEMDATVT